jgi:hypothetical protein
VDESRRDACAEHIIVASVGEVDLLHVHLGDRMGQLSRPVSATSWSGHRERSVAVLSAHRVTIHLSAVCS